MMATTISASRSACGSLARREFAPHELPFLIEAIFASEDAGDTIRCLFRDDAQTFIDVIDEALDRPDLSPHARKKCLKSLYKTCGHYALLPKALKIPVCYDRTSAALYRGGHADVWKGKHHDRDVAVKVIRVYSNSDLQKIIGRFCKEVITWKTLQHPNVLALIGVTMSETQFAMISDWMVNGNIGSFVKAHPDANRLGLLEDVARGLIYIHGQEMIHGDLKGANILIDQTGHARLADFGLLTIISDPSNLLSSSSCNQGGTVRWMSPERIAPERFGLENSRPTKSSDCYALGMVIYETISGNLPFHKHSYFTVSLKVMEGERPPRGVGFTESLWKMLEQCWISQPGGRPSIEDILQRLEIFSDSAELPSAGVDEETNKDSDDSDLTNSSSHVPNGTNDMMVTESSTATSSGLGYPTNHPPDKAHAGSLDHEMTDLDLPIPRIDSNGGGNYQDLPTVSGAIGEAHSLAPLWPRRSSAPPHRGAVIPGGTSDGVYGRLLENITIYIPDPQVVRDWHYAVFPPRRPNPHPQDLPPGLCIPQRPYCQGTAIPEGVVAQRIVFTMANGGPFPAEFSLVGQCDLLVDGGDEVFSEQNHTINLRIEWPGYSGWGAQIRIVNYRIQPKGITRAKLVTEIAKQLERFIEKVKVVPIDPAFPDYKVGPGGIELRHIHIASLEQVSRGSWQPRLIYIG